MDINVRDFRQRIFDKISIKLNNQQIVLDVGCGDGGDCEILLENAKEVVGIDIESHPIWSKTKNDNLHFGIVDACSLPFPDDAFDVVFEKDVLHHIEDHKRALGEMKRVAKKYGQTVIIEANRYNPILYLHMTLIKSHQHFTKKYFEDLITSNFEDATFLHIETHVYPIKSKLFLKLIHFIEDFLPNIPLVKNYLSYNIASIENRS